MAMFRNISLFVLLVLMITGCEWDREYNYGHRRRHLFFRTSRAMFSPLDTLNVDAHVIKDLEEVRYKRPNLRYWTAKNWTSKMQNTDQNERVSLYTLEPGSTFRLDVDGEDKISTTYVVGPDGYINIPLCDDPIYLMGKTYKQAKIAIVTQLEKYIKNPKVSTNAVLIKLNDSDSFNSGEAILIGGMGGGESTGGARGDFLDTRGSGHVPTSIPVNILRLSGSSTFLRAIAQGGGLGGEADMQNIVVMRKINDEIHIIIVDFQRLTQFADFSQNINILKGDIIYIPIREHSIGEQFAYEWSTALRYLGGLITWDFAIEQFKEHGRIF